MNELKLKDRNVLVLPEPWVPVRKPKPVRNWGGWGGC